MKKHTVFCCTTMTAQKVTHNKVFMTRSVNTTHLSIVQTVTGVWRVDSVMYSAGYGLPPLPLPLPLPGRGKRVRWGGRTDGEAV